MSESKRGGKIMFHFLGVILAVFTLSGCTESILAVPQIPGRSGLLLTLARFESETRWRNWSSVLGSFYLPDHASEAQKKHKRNLGKWFGADPVTAALAGGEGGDLRHLCVLAFRKKNISPRYKPHFIVYYRVQKAACQKNPNEPAKTIAEGRMEWGFETRQRRWIHLRSLG